MQPGLRKSTIAVGVFCSQDAGCPVWNNNPTRTWSPFRRDDDADAVAHWMHAPGVAVGLAKMHVPVFVERKPGCPRIGLINGCHAAAGDIIRIEMPALSPTYVEIVVIGVLCEIEIVAE